MIERVQTRPEDRLGAIDDPGQVAEDREVVALLWDAADALGERDREVLDLTLRHGLAPNEIAEVIGLNRNATNQLVHRVRQHLGTAVGARVLWRDGAPSCFGAARRTDGGGCERLRRRRGAGDGATRDDVRRVRRTPPDAPLAGFDVRGGADHQLPRAKAKTAFALDAEGVPMQGSSAFAGEPVPGTTRHRGRARRITLAVVGGRGSRRRHRRRRRDTPRRQRTDPGQRRRLRRAGDDAVRAVTTTTTHRPDVSTRRTADRRGRAADDGRGRHADCRRARRNLRRRRTRQRRRRHDDDRGTRARRCSFTITPATVAWTPSGYPASDAAVVGRRRAGRDRDRTGGQLDDAPGQQPVCPTAVNAGGFCTAGRGAYTYVLQVKDGGGLVIDQRTQT